MWLQCSSLSLWPRMLWWVRSNDQDTSTVKDWRAMLPQTGTHPFDNLPERRDEQLDGLLADSPGQDSNLGLLSCRQAR